jgi:hypothetical protein
MSAADPSGAPVAYIEAPRHADLRALHHYWNAKRGARAMPGRADINPAEIKPLLPDVMIWSALDPFLIRLVGDHIVRFVGANNTGRPATHGMPTDAASRMRAVIATVIESRSPRFRFGKAYWLAEKSYRDFEACFLPLSADGESVDMILGGLKFDFD